MGEERDCSEEGELDVRYLMPDAGCKMPDAGCKMPDGGCMMPDARYMMPDARYLMLMMDDSHENG